MKLKPGLGLLIEDHNTAARSAVVTSGFREVAHWFYGTRQIAQGELDPAGAGLNLSESPQPLNAAPAVDIEPAYLTWQASELAKAAHGMIPLSWALRRMSIEDLVESVRSRTMYEGPSGWAVIAPRDESGVWVPWLVTIPDEAYALIRAITARIAADGWTEAGLLLPNVRWLVAAAERAGYETHPNTVWQLEIR